MAAPRKYSVAPGERYGRGCVLALTSCSYQRRDGRTVQFRAAQLRCDCGAEYTAHLNKVVLGHTTSCGCAQREDSAARAIQRNAALNPQPVAPNGDPDQARRRYLWQKYRMTLEEYNAKLEAQGGVCAMCGEPPGDVPLHVDHDHDCCPGPRACGDCNRGLLCFPCNTFLERFLRQGSAAMAYLAEHGREVVLAWRRRPTSSGAGTGHF